MNEILVPALLGAVFLLTSGSFRVVDASGTSERAVCFLTNALPFDGFYDVGMADYDADGVAHMNLRNRFPEIASPRYVVCYSVRAGVSSTPANAKMCP